AQVQVASLYGDIGDVHRPYLVAPFYLKIPQKIFIDPVQFALAPLGGVRLRTRGGQAHKAEQPFDPLFVDLVPHVLLEPRNDARNAQPRVQQILFIYEPHELQVLGGLPYGLVIDAASVDVQQFALAHHAQLSRLVNMRPSLLRIFLHDKAFFKKSISIFCCPMVLNKRSSLSWASVLASLALFSKTASPFFRNCVFQLVIWAGWISCFLPSSWIVKRSDSASSTTLNLNSGVNFLRVITQ